MPFFLAITVPRNEVQALYDWLDVHCPSWEFEASYAGAAGRSHAFIRKENEAFLRHMAEVQTPNGPAQLKPTSTGIRVTTQKEAMSARLAFLDCKIEPRGV